MDPGMEDRIQAARDPAIWSTGTGREGRWGGALGKRIGPRDPRAIASQVVAINWTLAPSCTRIGSVPETARRKHRRTGGGKAGREGDTARAVE
jgi:hypothetical protein